VSTVVVVVELETRVKSKSKKVEWRSSGGLSTPCYCIFTQGTASDACRPCKHALPLGAGAGGSDAGTETKTETGDRDHMWLKASTGVGVGVDCDDVAAVRMGIDASGSKGIARKVYSSYLGVFGQGVDVIYLRLD
jgi:hypothetical protein